MTHSAMTTGLERVQNEFIFSVAEQKMTFQRRLMILLSHRLAQFFDASKINRFAWESEE